MDEEQQPGNDSKAPLTQQAVTEWQAELSAAIRKLYKDGYFAKGRSIWMYWTLAAVYLFFLFPHIAPYVFLNLERALYRGAVIVACVFVLWVLYVSILRHRVQIRLSNSEVIDNLVKGKLRIERILEYVPNLFRYRLEGRLKKGLIKRLEILAENLDWYLREPHFVLRIDWPCGCYVVLYILALLLILNLLWLILESLGESANAVIGYLTQSNTSSSLVLAIALPFLFALNIARKAVFAEELFRAVGFKMREDFFSADDERKGGAEAFRSQLAALVTSTGQLQSLGFGFIVAVPVILAFSLADATLIGPLTAAYAILMQVFVIRIALVAKTHHRAETNDALASSSMAVKLLGGEIDPNNFSLEAKWLAPLFGAPLKRGSLLRTAVMAALDPAELLKLPRRQPALYGLNLRWQLGFAVFAVCYLAAGIAVGMSWQRLLVMFIAIPLLNWMWQYILVSFARQGARVTEILIHIQEKIQE